MNAFTGKDGFFADSILSPLLSQVKTHVTSISQVLEPLSPSVIGLLCEGVLNDGEVVAETGSFGEEGEAHNVGEGAEGTTDLDLFRGQLLLNVEVFHSVQERMNGGLILSRSDSHLLIAVGVVIHLHNLSDECALGISRVDTGIESVMSVVIISVNAVVAHPRDVSTATSR